MPWQSRLAAAQTLGRLSATRCQVHPGAPATFPLRVGNVGHTPLYCRRQPLARWLLSENGATRFAAGPRSALCRPTRKSPRAPHPQGAPGEGRHVSVRMPAQIRADDYFLGFLVSPVVTSPAVRAVNDVGRPGRTRRARARAPPLLRPGSSICPHSFGRALSRAREGQEQPASRRSSSRPTPQVSGVVAPRPRVIMEPAHLLPPGLYWDVPIALVVVAWPGLVHGALDARLQRYRPAHR